MHPDVVVIGGGPAGSTVSTLLAQHGCRVVLYRARALSALPYRRVADPRNLLGLSAPQDARQDARSPFVKKYSVQFVNAAGKLSAPFYFHDNKPHDCSQTWQVIRSEFDLMMLQNAQEQGVEVHQATRVLEVLFDGDRAVGRAHPAGGRHQGRSAGAGGGRCERPEHDAAESLQAPAVGPGAEQGRDLDILARRLPRHGPGRGRHARHPDAEQGGLVVVHPPARRHRQRRRDRAVRLPVQGPRQP